ncbi:MAG TPA: carboxymuconolactone decarboxylase family protein [Mycobacterium sp.]|nr:carboxymuconolactone decarboxylase family protein [Mycobacterium sp.]
MDVGDELTRLVALTGGRIGGVVRQVCAQTLGLPPLPAAVAVGAVSDGDAVVIEFAEQFSIDVSVITDQQRSRLWAALGDSTFSVVVQMYIADFAPRVRAGLATLGLPEPWPPAPETMAWDGSTDPSDAVFNGFLPAVARLRALDAVTSEVVRLRGAAQHNCRLCKSLREGTALDAGGSETLYDDIAGFETSALLSERHKAALRYVDVLIWSPARIGPDVAAGVRRHFSDDEAVELTLDVMRNASNKIAVALGGDAPRVEHGTERYLLGADGQTVFS